MTASNEVSIGASNRRCTPDAGRVRKALLDFRATPFAQGHADMQT